MEDRLVWDMCFDCWHGTVMVGMRQMAGFFVRRVEWKMVSWEDRYEHDT